MNKLLMCCSVILASSTLIAADHLKTTTNFIILTDNPELSEKIAESAEHYRLAISKDWFGDETKPWSSRCVIRVKIDLRQVTGRTIGVFNNRDASDMVMILSGSEKQILNEVLPHEMAHALFLTNFDKPVPLWAHEGVASQSDSDELQKHYRNTISAVKGIYQTRTLLNVNDYPPDQKWHEIFYAQSNLLVKFLINEKDKLTFIKFITYAEENDWDDAIYRYYGYKNAEELDDAWRKYLAK